MYYLIKTKGVSGVAGGFNRTVVEISAEEADKLDEKLANFGKSMESSEAKSATLILSEKEAGHLLNSSIAEQEVGGLGVFKDFDFDFEPESANIYATGPYNSEFKVEIFIEKEDDSILPFARNVNLGKLKLPSAVVNKINDAIYQGVEQMKTENMGSLKITNLRIMQDSVVIEVEKV